MNPRPVFYLTNLLFLTQLVNASALTGPQCFVTAEIVGTGQKEEGGGILLIKIKDTDESSDCPIKVNEIYPAVDNHPGTLLLGDEIKAGIESTSSMGPAGPVTSLHWSDVTDVDGSPIKSKNNQAIIDHLQSNDKPLEKTIQPPPNPPKTPTTPNNSNNIYLLIPLVIIAAIVGYATKKPKHKK